MTKEEIFKIKEHIEIHARREPYAIKITEIMWKAVAELEHLADLEKENTELKEQLESERDLPAIAYMQGAEKQKKKDEEQLTKAMELLKHWANSYGYIDIALCKQTQQFLNEVKK